MNARPTNSIPDSAVATQTYSDTLNRPACVAVIADIVQSRRLDPSRRSVTQSILEAVLEHVNRVYRKEILAKFLVTVGDEFQGLLKDPTILPDLLWTIERALPRVELRVGVGFGPLDTELKEHALGMDGPVWHYAREAIESAKATRRAGGVFLGFGPTNETVLNGFARLHHHLRSSMSDRQMEIVDHLRRGATQVEVSRVLAISKQVVSKQVKAAGWTAHSDGEAGWRAALMPFNTSREWSTK